MGSDIYWHKPPKAFWNWFTELQSKYDYATIEINDGRIVVCRVRTVIDSPTAAADIKYGKIICDATGMFLERTFWPRYYVEEDVVRPKT